MSASIDVAAPAKVSPSNLPLVLFAGAVTTVLTLAGVYQLELHGIAVMGWYANYILPAGAICAGLLAGSGAGIACWKSGTRVTKTTLFATGALMACAWGAARYLEYKVAVAQLGDDPPSFLVFFDYYARSITFEEHGKVGSPVGFLGYGVRLLELAGFVAGGLAGPGVARARRYCDECSRYMRSKRVSTLAIAGKPTLFGIGKMPAHEEEALATEGQRWLERVITAAAGSDAAALDYALGEHPYGTEAKRALAAAGRVEVAVARCPGCGRGELIISHFAGTTRKAKRVGQTVMPLSPGLVQALRS
jgi:hypothetical protein